MWLVTAAVGGESPTAKTKPPIEPAASTSRLASYNAQEPAATKETTTVTTNESSGNHWEIDGPVFLRSADPEPPGEVIIKNIFAWEHSKKKDDGGWLSGSDDDDEDRDEYEYELEVEWGVVENHELIFELPFQVGDGRVDGNGDLTVGWHWRLWDEQDDWVPALALRNYLRIPTGVDSSGVDYELRALLTKTLVPGSTRLHLNPFAKSVNGDNEEDAEPFQYGTAIGVDHRLSENLLFITDYVYHSEDSEDSIRGNHVAEFGLDWDFAEHQKLGLAFLVGLDGDTEGPEYGAEISYMLSFGG
jgi:hypothetical protein